MKRHVYQFAVLIALSSAAGSACGGSGGPSTPSGTPGGSSGGIGATITIRSDSTLEPNEVRINIGERVRFINQDGRQHQPTSNPHLSHTDCPAANLPVLSSGQSQETTVFDRAVVCGFHDHINPDTAALQGTIRVGGAEGPGGPVYVKH